MPIIRIYRAYGFVTEYVYVVGEDDKVIDTCMVLHVVDDVLKW